MQFSYASEQNLDQLIEILGCNLFLEYLYEVEYRELSSFESNNNTSRYEQKLNRI